VESERQAALGALIPVVAHNIRNPLASIRATAQMLDEMESREDLKESRQAILETIDRRGRWVNTLVSYLHPLEPSKRIVHAGNLLETAEDMLDAKLEEKNLQLIKRGWENDTELEMDPDLMEQALYCLLSNAIDASPVSGEIELSMIKAGYSFYFCIKDQGSGLMFEPRQGNLEPGPSTKKFGTGLGIPVAFKICQSHGWELDFSSNENGTVVKISCPLSRQSETA